MAVVQRFSRGDLVRLTRPSYEGRTAVVDGSYAEVCNAHHIPGHQCNLQIYALFILMKDENRPVTHISWFHEYELELIKERDLAAIQTVENWLRNGYYDDPPSPAGYADGCSRQSHDRSDV